MHWPLAIVLACRAFPSLVAAATQPRIVREELGLDRDSLPAAAPQSGSAATWQAVDTLGKVARSAVADAIERRAPKFRAPNATHLAVDTVLLAVSDRGNYIRLSKARTEQTSIQAQLEDLLAQKNAAVAVEDYDEAKRLKVAIHALKDQAVDGHHAKVEQDLDLDAASVPLPSPKVAHGTVGAVKGNTTMAGNTTKNPGGGLLMSVTSDQLIKVYMGIVPVVLILCIVFECVHKRWAGIDLNEPIANLDRQSEAGQGMAVSTWMSGFWPLTRPFFFEGPMAGTAKLLIVSLTALAVWALFMDWARNIWQRDFWDAIQEKHVNRFWQAMLLFVEMAVVNVLCSTYQDYAQSILCIRWRASLTKSLQEKWLLGRAYCVQHFPPTPEGQKPLENPDQRLQEDVDGFIQGGIALFFGSFMSIGRLALFTPILFMLSPNMAFGYFYCPGWLLYVALIYSGLGSLVTHSAGRWLIPLSFIKQQVEADYRHTAVQVRDHTESIAMYGSEDTENHRLSGRFDRIQRVVWEQMKYSKQLGFFRNFYFLADGVVPFCILGGNYFRGQITLGQMMQILGALGHVSESLNSFIGAYTQIADLRATTDRLYGFQKGVEKGAKYVEDQTMAREVSAPGDTAALYAQEVCVNFPAKADKEGQEGGDRILWDKAGLVVQPGERVLLLGPDGCGKSVFLRALAGCWPATGSVRIGRGDSLFVPQRPFVPAGALREALAYPEQATQYTDEDMLVALKAVRLTALDEVPLSEEADWQRRLSGGELQRLALAHALLRKPGLLVLDETTAAIGEEGTAELYALLGKTLPPSTAVISVDHDAINHIGDWHNVHYTLDAGTHRWTPA